MVCVCGHSDDLHDEEAACVACECEGFMEDVDEDELEGE
jgi:hypothetical protein